MFEDALDDFRADWMLVGKAQSSVQIYISHLRHLAIVHPEPDLASCRDWAFSAPTVSVRRKRIQAVRAFGRWSESIGEDDFPWWRKLPVPVEPERPQETATLGDFEAGVAKLSLPRDRAILSVLWGCGLRRSEVANLKVDDVFLAEGVLVVRSAKNGQPRMVPIPPFASRAVRQHLRGWKTKSLFDMSTNGLRLMLRRHGLMPAHAWRRGWAVHSLRAGISETSVRSAAGWSSGAMVARYTRAKAAELALHEYRATWKL